MPVPLEVVRLKKTLRMYATLATFLGTALMSMSALAGPREDLARKLEKAGEALFQAGKYEEAVKQFQEVVRKYRLPKEVIRTARWNIARCYEELGNDEAALTAFSDFAKRAKTRAEKRDVAAKLKQVKSRLAAVVILAVEPKGAKVRVDGRTIGTAPLSRPLELAPGRHLVTVSRSGFRSKEKQLNLKSKEKKEVIVKLEAMQGTINVRTDGGRVRQAAVLVDGRELYRGALPAKLQVAAGKRKVVVTVPGSADRTVMTVKIPDKGVIPIILKVSSPPTDSSPIPTDDEEPAIGGQVALSLGEGFLCESGQAEQRTHVTLEALGGMRFRGARWLQVELALAMSVESPIMFLLRPGLRFYTGEIPIFFRLAAQVMVTPSQSGGILLGAGGEIPVGKGWSLPLGLEINLWPSAISLVPLEFKIGVAYEF